ncbi:MAG: tripartite tricarboxylate transporter substrate binding protein [Burkholderiales bacterium]|nr:tripartite tricarboxylate transporter substrate binding protein [Burkholderiales bacterium]
MASFARWMRRTAAVVALGLACATAMDAVAQAYPSRPVRLYVGFAPGGPADIVARAIAQRLSTQLGQPVVVENKPGADSRIMAQQLAAAPPDGYTIGLVDSGLVVNALMFAEKTYDPVRDFSPVFFIGEIPNFIVATPKLPVANLAEFIAYAKANPGKLNYAATASSTMLAAEMLKSTAGIDVVRVPYKGAALGTPALLAGDVHCMVSAVGPLAPLIKEGKVKALAVTAKQRTPVSPDTPTTAEAGLPAMVYVNWYAIVAPAGVPRPIVDHLNADLRKVVADPEARAQLLAMGLEPAPSSPEELGALVKADIGKIDKLIKTANIKIE